MTSEQTMSGSIRSISLYRQMRAYHFTPSEMLIAYQQPPTKTKYEPLIRFTPQILILYPCKIDLLYARYAIRLGLRLHSLKSLRFFTIQSISLKALTSYQDCLTSNVCGFMLRVFPVCNFGVPKNTNSGDTAMALQGQFTPEPNTSIYFQEVEKKLVKTLTVQAGMFTDRPDLWRKPQKHSRPVPQNQMHFSGDY